MIFDCIYTVDSTALHGVAYKPKTNLSFLKRRCWVCSPAGRGRDEPEGWGPGVRGWDLLQQRQLRAVRRLRRNLRLPTPREIVLCPGTARQEKEEKGEKKRKKERKGRRKNTILL